MFRGPPHWLGNAQSTPDNSNAIKFKLTFLNDFSSTTNALRFQVRFLDSVFWWREHGNRLWMTEQHQWANIISSPAVTCQAPIKRLSPIQKQTLLNAYRGQHRNSQEKLWKCCFCNKVIFKKCTSWILFLKCCSFKEIFENLFKGRTVGTDFLCTPSLNRTPCANYVSCHSNKSFTCSSTLCCNVKLLLVKSKTSDLHAHELYSNSIISQAVLPPRPRITKHHRGGFLVWKAEQGFHAPEFIARTNKAVMGGWSDCTNDTATGTSIPLSQWFSNFFWSRTICVSRTVITYHLVPGKVNVPNIIRSKVWKTRIDTNPTWAKWLWEILMAIIRKQQEK